VAWSRRSWPSTGEAVTADVPEPGAGEPARNPLSGGTPTPAEAPAPGRAGAVTASSMDSITLPERSRHEGAPRALRRRRSAAHSPVVVAPIDIPEDAEGRVEIFAVRAPEDVDAPSPSPPVPTPPLPSPDEAQETAEVGAGGVLGFGAAPATAERAGWGEEVLALRNGWVAVSILAVLLAALFVIGDLLTR
jgi:hypothetical protein